MNAASVNKKFQSARANMLIDNFKMKHIPESRISNIDTVKSKNVVQRNKILNNKLNNQSKAMAKELKYAQKMPLSPNKLVLQKKKMLAAKKARASLGIGEIETEIEETLKIPKVKKVSNVQIQKTKLQEKTATVQKTKAQETPTVLQMTKVQENPNAIQKTEVQVKPTVALKTKAQEKPFSGGKTVAQNNPTAIQKTTTENDISTPNHKVPENINCTSTINTAAQNTKSQVNSPKIAPVIDQKTNTSAQENKPQETVKDAKVSSASSTDQSKIELSSEEKCELDPILARAVEEELQDIMIQVWQELPDEPVEEGDRIAVEKLRNEAGDDLRRVLGLNITKRLLNVYNNLFLKIQFTCRPQIGCLTSFLNKYHINKFKRIDNNSNTFAAQMDTIEDFDDLCAVRELMCGEAKVTITPCYKFTQCPEKLKTIYDDTYFYEDTTQEHIESPKSKNQMQKTKNTLLNDNIAKLPTKVDKIATKATDKPDTTETNKPANSIRIDLDNPKNDFKIVDKEKTTDSLKNSSVETKLKDNKNTVNVTKEKGISRDEAKDNLDEYIIKDKLETDEDDDELDSGVPECQMEGEDELNDEDILALMSEGVVLDECSGSEDEN